MIRPKFALEPKFDGVATGLHCETGTLERRATRSDGTVREDVIANARTIKAVPLKFRGSGWPHVRAVRGDVFMPKAASLRTTRAG